MRQFSVGASAEPAVTDESIFELGETRRHFELFPTLTH